MANRFDEIAQMLPGFMREGEVWPGAETEAYEALQARGGSVSPVGYAYPDDPVTVARNVERRGGWGGVLKDLVTDNWVVHMLQSGAALPRDVISGKVPLRTPHGEFNPEVVQRAMDTAGLVAGGSVPATYGSAKNALGKIVKSDLEPVTFNPFEEMTPRERLLAQSRQIMQGRPLMADDAAGTGVAAVGASQRAPTFYSALEHAVDNAKMTKGTPEQWANYIRNQPGVKGEEMAWLGLGDEPFIPGPGWQGTVTKQQVKDWVAQNKVETRDVWKKDGPPDAGRFEGMRREHEEAYGERLTNEELLEEYQALYGELPVDVKYSDYQLPGGDNYRELLMTLPRKDGGDYKSSHWDEPNVLAHVRMNDRATPDGQRLLHLEEVQSDWHQAGRKEGYKGKKESEGWSARSLADQGEHFQNMWEVTAPDGGVGEITASSRAEAISRSQRAWLDDKRVPDAPFKSSWADLALKRVLREAAEGDYDAISWTPGEQQAARYDLSNHISEMRVVRTGDTYQLYPKKPGGGLISFPSTSAKGLADVIGKEMAEKITKNKADDQYYSNLDLKVGGEGMKAFYDKMLVDKVNALGKKYGAKVEWREIDTPANRGVAQGHRVKIPIFRVSQKMRDDILGRGQPLFATGIPFPLQPVDYDPFGEQK